MTRSKPVLLFGAAALALGTTIVLAGAARPTAAANPAAQVALSIAKIYWEFNATANDLGVHVMLDGEDWKKMEIEKPNEQVIFKVQGYGPYQALGMTELFFEGAEPSLDDVPLAQLLAMFPEGPYEFSGKTVDGEEIEGIGMFSHAVPAAPDVFTTMGPNNLLQISWNAVTAPPPGFPNRPIDIVGYQVIVEKFQVTVPGSVLSVTISPEFVRTLTPGQHQFEVLAIEASGNQTITEGYFVQ